MMNAMHGIFSEQIASETHEEFVKFSKGIFENRYLLEGKKQKEQWVIKTSAEFANFFVREGLKSFSGKIAMKGAIITTLDMKKDFPFPIAGIKQYMGIKQYLIEGEIEGAAILRLMEKFPRAFYALTFSLPEYSLKIKAKAPKSGKPSNKGDEGPKADFCSLKTTREDIVKDLFFDYPDFGEITIRHTLHITEIVLPKGVSDPKELREKAQRGGTIVRIISVDGKDEKKSVKFSV